MPGQLVQLDERALVEQRVDALAGGHLALGVLLLDGSRRAGVHGLVVAAGAGRRACRPWCGCRCSSGTSVPPGCARKRSCPRSVVTGGPTGPRVLRPGPTARCVNADSAAAPCCRALVPGRSVRRPSTRARRRPTPRSPPARPATGPEGWCVVAESQTAGRGRLDRSWTAPPRAGLTFSVLLRPSCPAGSGAGSRCWPGWPWPARWPARPSSTYA